MDMKSRFEDMVMLMLNAIDELILLLLFDWLDLDFAEFCGHLWFWTCVNSCGQDEISGL